MQRYRIVYFIFYCIYEMCLFLADQNIHKAWSKESDIFQNKQSSWDMKISRTLSCTVIQSVLPWLISNLSLLIIRSEQQQLSRWFQASQWITVCWWVTHARPHTHTHTQQLTLSRSQMLMSVTHMVFERSEVTEMLQYHLIECTVSPSPH